LAGSRQGGPALLVAQKLADRGGKACGIPGWSQDAGDSVADGFEMASGGGGYDRDPARQPLKDDQRKGLIDRRLDEDISGGIEKSNVVATAEEDDAASQIGLRSAAPKIPFVCGKWIYVMWAE
jgi:hypothetical protein